MAFDFDAAVQAPFRMQPGLRRRASDSCCLTPAAPGGRHQREKLAVLSAFWPQALLCAPGFEPGPALDALCQLAAREHPHHWQWDGHRACVPQLGYAVDRAGLVQPLTTGRFGLGDECPRCLDALPARWRLAGALALCFEEDVAVIQGPEGRVQWLAVALPSHWAPEDKLDRPLADVHAPVADNALLLRAVPALAHLMLSDGHWERFVWNVTDHPRLHAHPARCDPQRWLHTPVSRAWWRTERQTFLPVAGHDQAIFTISVQVQPLVQALQSPGRAARLHDALASMSEPVRRYRGLTAVQSELLAWLREQP